MNAVEITALALVGVTLIMAVTTVVIVRLVVRDTTAHDRARILLSVARLILAVRGRR